MTSVDATPVTAFFQALTDRDFVAARGQWRGDGVWHLGGQHDLVGDYSADGYVQFLQEWFTTYREYAVSGSSIQNYGTDIVVVHLETTGGRAPSTSGLMIFRIDGGVIAEGWAIPTTHQGSEPF